MKSTNVHQAFEEWVNTSKVIMKMDDGRDMGQWDTMRALKEAFLAGEQIGWRNGIVFANIEPYNKKG